jgi:hypothetical protein
MNRIQPIRRITAALTGLAGALLLLAAAAPATLARAVPTPPPIREKHPPLPPGYAFGPAHQNLAQAPIHSIVIGGMPGWQIALIAAGAALIAATVAVLLDRAWTAHRKTLTTAD